MVEVVTSTGVETSQMGGTYTSYVASVQKSFALVFGA
jgi:hypothetical protein